MDAIYPALLATINNVAAYLEDLSSQSSSRLLHLYSTMSAPSFLLANETNYTLLQSLLESVNAIVEHQYSSLSVVINDITAKLTSIDRQSNLYTSTLQVSETIRGAPILHS